MGYYTSFSDERGGQPGDGEGEPDPKQLTLHHAQAALAEKTSPNGRNLDWRPGKKVTPSAERGEEGDAQSAVGKRIQDSVGRRHQEEKAQQSPPWARESPYARINAPAQGNRRKSMSERRRHKNASWFLNLNPTVAI